MTDRRASSGQEGEGVVTDSEKATIREGEGGRGEREVEDIPGEINKERVTEVVKVVAVVREKRVMSEKREWITPAENLVEIRSGGGEKTSIVTPSVRPTPFGTTFSTSCCC
jgi:hypothetical protein